MAMEDTVGGDRDTLVLQDGRCLCGRVVQEGVQERRHTSGQQEYSMARAGFSASLEDLDVVDSTVNVCGG